MYNDFPIMRDDEYKLLNEHYGALSKWERQPQIESIQSLMLTGLNFCYNHNPKQPQIKSMLQNAKNCYQKISDNLASLFYTSCKTQSVTPSTSTISLAKTTVQAIREFQNWTSNEQKEYYKLFALNSEKELTKILFDIISILEKF